MKTLALFDFDGTITTKDTFPLFFKFTFGSFYFYLGFSLFIPLFILFKLKMYDAEKFKVKMISFYLKGKSKDWIESKGKEFIEHLTISGIIKPEFINRINTLKNSGADVAVVSASPDVWIKQFCEQHNIICICTQLAYDKTIFNGKLIGNNCNAAEKKARITSQFNLSTYSSIIVFGDSVEGDGAMMELATEKNWV